MVKIMSTIHIYSHSGLPLLPTREVTSWSTTENRDSLFPWIHPQEIVHLWRDRIHVPLLYSCLFVDGIILMKIHFNHPELLRVHDWNSYALLRRWNFTVLHPFTPVPICIFWLSVLQWYLRLKEEGMTISFKCWSSGSCAIIISIEVDWKESLLCICLIILIIWCVEPLTIHLERSSRAAELKPKWETLALSLVAECAWTECKARNTRSHT